VSARPDPLADIPDADILAALAAMDAGESSKQAAARIGAPRGALLDLWCEIEAERKREAPSC
jgi:hypothetical protein